MQAWRQLGKSKTARTGVVGQHRGLDIVTSVAGAARAAQLEYLDKQITHMRNAGARPVIHRFFDSTPVRLRFGRLQSELQPRARYPIEIDGEWWATKEKEQGQKPCR